MKKETTLSRLYNKWEDLKEQAKEDCTGIHRDKLEQDFNLAELNIKWLNYQQDWQRVLISLESKRKRVNRELIEYYKMEYKMKFDTKDELYLFIETDEKYMSHLEQVQVVKAIVTYCIEVIDKLKGKSWEIKNWIDWNKWMTGAN
jgi:hypothetical protein